MCQGGTAEVQHCHIYSSFPFQPLLLLLSALLLSMNVFNSNNVTDVMYLNIDSALGVPRNTPKISRKTVFTLPKHIGLIVTPASKQKQLHKKIYTNPFPAYHVLSLHASEVRCICFIYKITCLSRDNVCRRYSLSAPVQLIQEHVVQHCVQDVGDDSYYHIWQDDILQVHT